MKIAFLPLQPHCFAYGGFDIQMQQTADAVSNCHVEISKLDIWDRNADFDILHCWGLSFSHYENYFWAKRSGKKLVATILMHDIESAKASFKFKISALVSKQRIIIDMLKMPDKIAVVNDNQASMANIYYKVPARKLHIIPNVVSESYFNSARITRKQEQGYILTSGNVCPRKNQITLAKACIQLNLKLIIVGKLLQGEEAYGNELEVLIEKNKDLIKWVPGLNENSGELIEYYQNCKLFALPSFVEQQPISALEAAVLQKPLLLADRTYAKQKFYTNAALVNPADIQSVKNGLQNVLMHSEKHIPPTDILQECRKQAVGLAYKEFYEQIL